jgi:putative ABC transport system permease protein
VGLYGVQSFLVARRTKEIGLRMAMGAEARGVVAGVVRSGLIMGGIGIAIGITAALGLSTFMRGVFYGVSSNDPLIYAVVSALLLASCLVASLVPAIRASRINPVEALRQD